MISGEQGKEGVSSGSRGGRHGIITPFLESSRCAVRHHAGKRRQGEPGRWSKEQREASYSSWFLFSFDNGASEEKGDKTL